MPSLSFKIFKSLWFRCERRSTLQIRPSHFRCFMGVHWRWRILRQLLVAPNSVWSACLWLKPDQMRVRRRASHWSNMLWKRMPCLCIHTPYLILLFVCLLLWVLIEYRSFILIDSHYFTLGTYFWARPAESYAFSQEEPTSDLCHTSSFFWARQYLIFFQHCFHLVLFPSCRQSMMLEIIIKNRSFTTPTLGKWKDSRPPQRPVIFHLLALNY